MKIVNDSYEILTDLSNPISILKNIESIARTCYKSEDKITDDSCIRFCKMLVDRDHTAMLEHSQISIRFIIDRAIANELTRHRICSFAQESTRYINYSNDKFGNEIKVIMPITLERDSEAYNTWKSSCEQAEKAYMALVSSGVKAEIARSVLPLCTATELVMTTNIRELRNIFKLRTSKFAHPQVRSIMNQLLRELQSNIPVLFDDISVDD